LILLLGVLLPYRCSHFMIEPCCDVFDRPAKVFDGLTRLKVRLVAGLADWHWLAGFALHLKVDTAQVEGQAAGPAQAAHQRSGQCALRGLILAHLNMRCHAAGSGTITWMPGPVAGMFFYLYLTGSFRIDPSCGHLG